MKKLSLFLFLSGIASAQQAPPRAQPLEDDVPRAVPIKPAAPIVDAPRAQPIEDKPKTKGPDDDLFDYATLAFSQKDYVIAAQSFGQYLKGYPGGSHTPDALFKLAECYRLTDRIDEAERYYREVVDKHPKSEPSALAAYWLGGISLKGNDYKAAATFFGFCATRSENPKVKNAAGYYQAEAYGQLKDRKKQLEALKPVLEAKKNNDFLEKALLASATIHQADGNVKLALPELMELLDTSKDPAVQGDAALKAAIIQGELKRPDEAAELYQRVLKNSVAPADQRGAALVGLISELNAKKDYDGVVDTYNRNASLLPPTDLRPRLLMHVGNAQRSKKAYARAVEMYEMIQQYFPDHELAFEAGYWRVYCFYLLEDKKLPDVATAFVKKFASEKKDHEYINTARLLIADSFFTRPNYALAADAYSLVNINKLQDRFRASTLFHKGWSEAEAGKHNDAITSLSLFISTYASDADIPKALAKRGLSYKQSQDSPKALTDFQRIIKEFPKSDAVELALYLSGVIRFEQRDWKAMVSDFDALAQQSPNSPAIAEASYKTGVGYIELKDTDKALPYFRKAVERDSKAFAKIGTEKILLCLWNKKDAEALSKEVDDYRAKYENATIPPSMLGYLGLTFYDKKDFARSAKYLTWASTPDTPENTDPRIWNYLGQALLETKQYDDCVKAIEHFLNASDENMGKARGYYTKASALVGLGKFEDAVDTTDDGLAIVKDGGLQGQLLIVQGDALLAEGDKLETDGNHDGAKEKWKASASKYVVPSQVIKDDYVTPLALDKAAQALERLGDKTQADAMRTQLKKEYPNFKSAQ